MTEPADRTDPSTRDADEHSTLGSYVTGGEAFERDTQYIEDRIVADPAAVRALPAPGRSKIGTLGAGLSEGAQAWPVEANRYRLIAAPACPWANRTLIVRRLLGLEDAISIGRPGPIHDARSWTFDLDPDGRDPVLGSERLQEHYFARFPGYPRGITVPAIVDIPSGGVVTNDYPQITLDFSTEWRAFHREGAPDLLPAELVDEMWPVIQRVFTEVNNGVYRCGFAGSQEAYDDAYRRLWETLDWLEDRLSTHRFLMGDRITEADVRLFTTLVRFDPVYHGHFKTNRNRLTEMPNLWAYARELFQTPGFGDTVDFVQIKQHYYVTHRDINPTGIVPAGPDLENWLEPHGRERFGGSPFGDGTAPGSVRPDERITPGHSPLVPSEFTLPN
ncbi:glutathione S-transferase C-terminal domain-containing protein [Leucobacter rhizosphaerae]|uniref:Glutathione S-transferase C-terminal domain-containing protein n=1 Tax=Leucobacter rhizosphaerae TaxID=2932245 RepID=A0ABY4FXC0_9MICO|nr:glutathione S-transferase C-terminal domain-containing protein [Leucobacter rhizosphaerae]UOQ60871.1 glutathione S-transferase C-terminal domain-containing protein [Leucobacter rhizosphaerae]